MFALLYNKYKHACLLSVIMMTLEIYVWCEVWLILELVCYRNSAHLNYIFIRRRVPISHTEVSLSDPDDEFSQRSHVNQLLFWSNEQLRSVFNIYTLYSPICSTLFAGIYSDKYGGKNSVLLGFVLCGLVSSASYLVTSHNDFIFLSMLIVRKIAEGMITAAVWSLAGKWAIPGERTIFVSILLVGQSLGHFIGNFIVRTKMSWEIVNYVIGCVCLIMAVGWWLLFRLQHVQNPRKCTVIPWRSMLTSIPLFVIVLLSLSFTLIQSTSDQLVIFSRDMLYLDVDPGWKIPLIMVLTKILPLFMCGISSDYIISKEYLSPFALRRIITGGLLPFFLFTLLLKFCQSGLQVILGCCVMVNFVSAVLQSTFYTTILDVTAAYSGIVFGVVIWLSQVLNDQIWQWIFKVSGPKFNMKSWNELFFFSVTVAVLFSLPFIFCGVKKSTWGNGVFKNTDKNHGLESTASKDAAGIQDNNPGPSNTEPKTESKND